MWDDARIRKVVGSTIAFLSIVALFWIGQQFDLFGQEINFVERPATYLFLGSICTGIFGAMITIFPVGLSAKIFVCVWGFYLLLFAAGKFSRGEL